MDQSNLPLYEGRDKYSFKLHRRISKSLPLPSKQATGHIHCKSCSTEIMSDDPFGGGTQPSQLAHLAPWSVELAGKIFATILSNLVAGKPAQQSVCERAWPPFRQA
jgi:hypothetical protein